jgi:hypothetical protein
LLIISGNEGRLLRRDLDGALLNAVEGFFAKLTNRRLKRGVFRSVADLEDAINRFVEEKPTPIRNPSCGPHAQTASSPLSKEGRKS